jgi:hypothetical protein
VKVKEEEIDEHISKLKKDVMFKKPVKLVFTKIFENSDDVLIDDLNIRFPKKEKYHNPDYQKVKLYSGKHKINEINAPICLIQAYYQGKKIKVTRHYQEQMEENGKIRVDYTLVTDIKS